MKAVLSIVLAVVFLWAVLALIHKEVRRQSAIDEANRILQEKYRGRR